MFDKNKKLFKDEKSFNSYRKKRIVYTSEDFGVKVSKHFSGASPPEIFVGRFNYPHVNAGILSPNSFEGSEDMSMPERWYEKGFNIGQVLMRRNQLIYGRFKARVKDVRKSKGDNGIGVGEVGSNKGGRFLDVMKEISMAYKPVSTEMFLKKLPRRSNEVNRISPIITNVSPLDDAKLQENPKVLKKVDYLVGDEHAKSVDSLNELFKSGVPVSNIMKILSAGLLGLKSQRRLVPTRWSITAVDDTLSKNLLKRIRYYPELDGIRLFHSEYNGNHYEILLLPGNFSFEVIEGEIKIGGVGNGVGGVGGGANVGGVGSGANVVFWQDFERFHGRKTYASGVVGAYYACRLAVCEYLERIKRQATCLFFREVRPEYYAPLGVGILREACRGAFENEYEGFATISEALEMMQERMRLNVDVYRERSELLKEYGKQKKIWDF